LGSGATGAKIREERVEVVEIDQAITVEVGRKRRSGDAELKEKEREVF
jgi:hypothetical protein